MLLYNLCPHKPHKPAHTHTHTHHTHTHTQASNTLTQISGPQSASHLTHNYNSHCSCLAQVSTPPQKDKKLTASVAVKTVIEKLTNHYYNTLIWTLPCVKIKRRFNHYGWPLYNINSAPFLWLMAEPRPSAINENILTPSALFTTNHIIYSPLNNAYLGMRVVLYVACWFSLDSTVDWWMPQSVCFR